MIRRNASDKPTDSSTLKLMWLIFLENKRGTHMKLKGILSANISTDIMEARQFRSIRLFEEWM